jgi:hypothetical protein
MEERDASCGEIMALDKVQVVVTVEHNDTVAVLPEMAHVLQAQQISEQTQKLCQGPGCFQLHRDEHIHQNKQI